MCELIRCNLLSIKCWGAATLRKSHKRLIRIPERAHCISADFVDQYLHGDIVSDKFHGCKNDRRIFRAHSPHVTRNGAANQHGPPIGNNDEQPATDTRQDHIG